MNFICKRGNPLFNTMKAIEQEINAAYTQYDIFCGQNGAVGYCVWPEGIKLSGLLFDKKNHTPNTIEITEQRIVFNKTYGFYPLTRLNLKTVKTIKDSEIIESLMIFCHAGIGVRPLRIYKSIDSNFYLLTLNYKNILIGHCPLIKIDDSEYIFHKKACSPISHIEKLFVFPEKKETKKKISTRYDISLLPLYFNDEEGYFHRDFHLNSILVSEDISEYDYNSFYEMMYKKYIRGRHTVRMPYIDIIKQEFELFNSLKKNVRRLTYK
jgi:hypothetical protein